LYVNRIFVMKPNERRVLGIPSRMFEDNIKTYRMKTDYEDMNWIKLAQDRIRGTLGVKTLASVIRLIY